MINKPGLKVEQRGGVMVVTLDDPVTMNAASPAMIESLLSLFDHIAVYGTRALLITGAGRGFCSGAMLSTDLDPEQPDYDAGRLLETHFAPLMRAMRDLPVPIVAAVNGAAAGGGCSIALACDIVIASENAYFLQAFRSIGLVPDCGSAYLLVRAAGRARAMEMMLLGQRIPAEMALQWGLVNRVVPAATLIDDALAIAADLAAGPTIALRGIRHQCWRAVEHGFEDMLAMERVQQRDAGRTADHREGIAAFLGKRPARFTGA